MFFGVTEICTLWGIICQEIKNLSDSSEKVITFEISVYNGVLR